MKISIRAVAATIVLSLCGIQLATAAEAAYFNAKEPVAPGSGVTYFDLALQFAPGLAKVPMDAGDIARLPHILGDEGPATIANPSLGSVERVDIKLDGKPALLLMFDVGYEDDSVASVNVLALYDMSGKPRLLDAINVGLDRETSFIETPYLQLSPKFGMAFVRNSHHNAGEEYLQTSLIGIWGGKLHEVDTVFSYSWMTGDQTVQTLPSFAAVKGAVAVDATFSIKTTRCEGGCEPDVTYPSTTEKAKARYRWDSASGKFVRPAKAFDKIPQPNMEE